MSVCGPVEAPAPDLTEAEAARRLVEDGPNDLPRTPPPTLVARVGRHLVEPLSLLLLSAAVVSGVVLGRVAEALAIGAIVVLNVVVATAQERRAADALAALEALTAPTARVRRDGAQRIVPARDLVRGDIVELAAGDRVPADIRLLEGAAVAADEAVLTGEAYPVEKAALADDDAGWLFAGTSVVRGRASGRVAATGARTRFGAIASALGVETPPPLLAELRRLAARLSLIAIAVGSLLVPIAAIRAEGSDALTDAVVAGVALAVAAIPEGLATIVTVSLALGARRMAARGAIVKHLAAIEGLGSVDVLCTDKTGTITTGVLEVAEVLPVPGRESDLWASALRCNDARDGAGDPIDVALSRAAPVGPSSWMRVAERPFDSETRMMSTLDVALGATQLSVKGAPEAVLARCRPGPVADELGAAAERLARDGLRVLAIAGAATDDLDAVDLEPYGLVGFHDPLRASAVDAIDRCERAGLRIVLVTGDHRSTAQAVATRAGIHGPAATGADLQQLDPIERTDRLRQVAVVARVDPETKVDLVEAHRAAGCLVAMTGDGVNDAPALRRADVGVAVAGDGATDVAREAADLVVTNGDLGTIVHAIAEGRRIRRNLRAVVSYLITGNLSEILVVALALAVFPDLAIPLLPVQLLWLNLVTDGLPALALGVDRPAADPLDGPPPPGDLASGGRLAHLAARAGILAVCVIAGGVAAQRWGWSDVQIRTQLLLSLLGAHLVLAYATRASRWTLERGWWRNGRMAAAVGGSLLLQVPLFGVDLGRAALGLAVLPAAGWCVAAVTALLAPIAAVDGLRVVTDHRRRAHR